jgi:hypothetical protein
MIRESLAIGVIGPIDMETVLMAFGWGLSALIL